LDIRRIMNKSIQTATENNKKWTQIIEVNTNNKSEHKCTQVETSEHK
jgi:hypothetical protein